MPKEWIDEADVTVSYENSKVLVNESFEGIGPFYESGGTASTRSVTLETTTPGLSYQGKNALKLSMNDATGAGTDKNVETRAYIGLADTEHTRYRLDVTFGIRPTAYTDWVSMLFYMDLLHATTGANANGSRALMALESNREATREVQYQDSAGSNVALPGHDLSLWPQRVNDTNVWHKMSLIADLNQSAPKYESISVNGRETDLSGIDARTYTGTNVAGNKMFLYFIFIADADGNTHDALISRVKLSMV